MRSGPGWTYRTWFASLRGTRDVAFLPPTELKDLRRNESKHRLLHALDDVASIIRYSTRTSDEVWAAANEKLKRQRRIRMKRQRSARYFKYRVSLMQFYHDGRRQ